MSLSLMCLPDDVLIRICSFVVSHRAKDFGNLQKVSKTFRCLCKESAVLRRVSFHEYSIDPLIPSVAQYKKVLELCCQEGNPDARYRKGVLQYFHPDSEEGKREEGLEMVAYAAEQGIEAAQLFYGLILICLGGEKKIKGYEVLTPLKKAIEQRMGIVTDYMHLRNLRLMRNFGCFRMVERLRNNYVRQVCSCVGRKEKLYEPAEGRWQRWRRWGKNFSKIYYYHPYHTCDICLWHSVLQITFDTMVSVV